MYSTCWPAKYRFKIYLFRCSDLVNVPCKSLVDLDMNHERDTGLNFKLISLVVVWYIFGINSKFPESISNIFSSSLSDNLISDHFTTYYLDRKIITWDIIVILFFQIPFMLFIVWCFFRYLILILLGIIFFGCSFFFIYIIYLKQVSMKIKTSFNDFFFTYEFYKYKYKFV